jgi:NuA3 HAT complex component NTO1
MAYTSVKAFNDDLLTMLSAQMDPAPVASTEDAEDESIRPTPQGLTLEQKETKKLIKRIIRSAQPAIEDAMRKEAELARAPVEKLPDLESILQQKLQGRQDASSVEDAPHETIETDEIGHEVPTDATTNGTDPEEANKKTEDIQLAPTPDDNAADGNHSMHDEATDEAAIAAQLGQDTLHISNGKQNGDAMEVDTKDTSGGTEPLTPPRSEKNLLNPLHNGGIPWYLEPFDIHGTTVYEPVWAGREVLKAMSEDLSELDDDELDGLAGSDPIQPDEDAADAQAIELRKAAARKRQRRSRAYR